MDGLDENFFSDVGADQVIFILDCLDWAANSRPLTKLRSLVHSVVTGYRRKPRFHMRPPDQLFYDGDLQLPPELILQVVSHLQTHDVLSFSLTCKAFYSLFFPTKQARSTSTMDRFLATLERDQPDLHYCHMCIQLHTWRNKDPIPSIRWSSRRTIWGPDCLFAPHGSDRQGVIYGRLSTAGVCKGLTLNFHDARLVMNFHLYGSNYGRPLSSIEHSDPLAHHSSWPPKAKPPSTIETNSKWHFRIVDDELLLKAEYTIRHLQGNEKQLHDWMKHCDRIICHHLHLGSVPHSRVKYVNHRIPEMVGQVRTQAGEDRYFRRRDGSGPHRSCYICFTDYEVTVRKEEWPYAYNTPGRSHLWRKDKEFTHAQGIVIRITTYQNFGAVRSPWDRKWAAMTNSRLVTCPRIFTDEPGAIERMWKRDSRPTADSAKTARTLWVLPEARVKSLVSQGFLNRRAKVQGPNGTWRFVEDRYGRREEDAEKE